MATLITPLRRATKIGGTRRAVVCGDEQLTYAETWERCRRLVGGLRALGLQHGDRVAVISPNCHRYVELYQAVPGVGLSIVPLNHRHTPAELRYALEDSGAEVLFTAMGDQRTDTLRRAHPAFPDAELVHLYGATETTPIATLDAATRSCLLDEPTCPARAVNRRSVSTSRCTGADGARADER